MLRQKAQAPGRQWPNLFVVGAPKAGTTALWRYLDAHPDVFMSPLKEPRFFARSPRLPSVEDAETYLGLFFEAQRERFRGEASPNYLYPEDVPEAIRRVSPEARIVISLREPVDLSHALHSFFVAHVHLHEGRTFAQAIGDELAGREYPDHPQYLRAAIFTPAVRRYLDTFGQRVFVLFFEDLASDTRGLVRRLFEFLDLDPTAVDHLKLSPHNQHALPRNRAARRLVRSRRAVRVARAIVPRSWRDPIWRGLVPLAEKPEPDPETVELLRELFEPDVVALRELLGRRLPEAWERRFPSAAPSPVEA